MSNLDELLNTHATVTKSIHEYFGYEQQMAVIPIEDMREYYWQLIQEEDGSGVVRFADNPTDLTTPGENYWQFRIYTQRHLPRHVYRTNAYTMVVAGNEHEMPAYKVLQIFNNFLEIL